MHTRLASYVFLGIAFCGFTVLLGATGRDDSHITFWVAREFAKTGSLVNYNGDAIEQSSSLLFTLLLGVGTWLSRSSPEVIAPILSLACGLLTWVIAAHLARRHAPELEPWTLAFGASCLPVAYWSLSGMEASLTSLLYVSFVLLSGRQLARVAPRREGIALVLVLVALLLVRPESPLVCLVALSLAAIIAARSSRRADLLPLLSLLAVTCGATLLIVAFRMHLFHLPVPLPVLAKAGATGSHAKLAAVEHGLRYLVRPDNLFGIGPVLWVCILGYLVFFSIALLRRRGIAPELLVCASFAITLLVFVVASGGDWMELGRFLVPLWPLALVLGLIALRTLVASRRLRLGVCSALLLFQLYSIPGYARAFSTGIPLWITAPGSSGAWMERHNGVHLRSLRFVPVLAQAIAEIARDKPDGRVSVLTGEMGTIPYHVAAGFGGRVRFIDRFGLATADVTSCALTRGLSRDALGVRMTYAFYLEHAQALADSCAMPLPDIMFDLPIFLNPKLLAGFEQLGFSIIHRQATETLTAGWLLDEPVRRAPILAVRRAAGVPRDPGPAL